MPSILWLYTYLLQNVMVYLLVHCFTGKTDQTADRKICVNDHYLAL